jgi:transposase-like protein
VISSYRLRPRELAARWGISTQTLERWRRLNKGPTYIKLNPRRVVYRMTDIQAFERENCIGAASRQQEHCETRVPPPQDRDAQIAQFIAERGVRKLPTRFLVASQAALK